jgi:2-methylisocitrate lyase-like PEP mutase family enzyme
MAAGPHLPGGELGRRRRAAIAAAATRTARGRPVVRAAASSSSSSPQTYTNPRAAQLRALLASPPGGILKGPCCHDALSARLIQEAGFPFAFMSGFCTAASRLAAPDTGLLSYGEILDTGRSLHEATSPPFPIIGDGDTGYGNAMNVRRTVLGYASAGFAGILIEDQVWPKSCGHVKGKRVVGREEAVRRVRAAADARDESGTGIVLVARSDARQAVSLEEALWRAEAFAEAGADVVFIDALESGEEMRALCRLAQGAGGAAAAGGAGGGANRPVYAMANMLEGGGKTPILPPGELAALGFSLVAYPMSLLGVSIRAMRGALEDLKDGRVPDADKLGTFADIQRAVGFDDYWRGAERYGGGVSEEEEEEEEEEQVGGGRGKEEEARGVVEGEAEEARGNAPGPVVVEPDAVMEAGSSQLVSVKAGSGGGGTGSGSSSSSSTNRAPSSRALEALKRSRFFRVTIRDRQSGATKLETRIPASFVGGLAALVPQVNGVDLDAVLSEIAGGAGGEAAEDLLRKPLVDVDAGGDRVQVFLE